jgi:MoxR-like ATPase
LSAISQEGFRMDLVTFRKALEAENYIFDEDFLITVYIAIKLGKPLLVEGAAGVGKTEIAKVLSSVYGEELVRLQCYEGLDESKALYEWNYQKQLLDIELELSRSRSDTFRETEAGLDGTKSLDGLFSEKFLLQRPLLKAINSEKRVILLIDEVDKTDEEFEAFLLELLSDFQITIPELGTIKAKSKPIVILTSNNARPLSEALKRRCTYLYIDYPSVVKEERIITAKLPHAGERLAMDVAAAMAVLRENDKIYKKPSIAETLDWVAALMAIGKTRLDEDGVEKTLGFILKNREDISEFIRSGGLSEFFDKKHC